MKLVKMSLAAVVLLGASAFAIDNIKVSGDAKLFYGSDNQDQTAASMKSDSMLGQDNSYVDTAFRLGVTGDLIKDVSFGAAGYAVSTLGLENNLVANTWTGAHDQATDDTAWMSELWLSGTVGKTTAKVGRMQLDTPLVFSETWSVAANTFDAAVLINQDLPDTALIGAWIGKSNGVDVNNISASTADRDAIFRDGAVFGTFGSKGAYAVGAINNSLKFLTAQAWYYNVVNIADAYWLQADWDCKLVKDVRIGAQYANMNPKGMAIDPAVLNLANRDSSAYAVRVGYEGIKDLKLSAAYSSTDKDGQLSIQNVAASGQSKLYTEAWWNYGFVGAPGADSYNVTAEYNAGFAKLGAYYTDVTVRPTAVANNKELTEVTLTASKPFGPLETTLAYISTDATTGNTNVNANGARYDSVQAYLALNF